MQISDQNVTLTSYYAGQQLLVKTKQTQVLKKYNKLLIGKFMNKSFVPSFTVEKE